jgi:ATP-dependent RNA helicase DDX23/PRP28
MLTEVHVAKLFSFFFFSFLEYTHRIGRTGRAGEDGEATSLITNADEDILYELKQKLVQTGNHVPPELAKHPAALAKPGTHIKSKIVYAKK